MIEEIGYDPAGNRVYAYDRPHLVPLHGLRHPSGKPIFLWRTPEASRPAGGPAVRTPLATVAPRGQDAVVVIPYKAK